MTQSQNNGVSLIIVPPFSGYRPSLNIFLLHKEARVSPTLPDHPDLLVSRLQTAHQTLFLHFSNYKIDIHYPISSHGSQHHGPRGLKFLYPFCRDMKLPLSVRSSAEDRLNIPQWPASFGRAKTTALRHCLYGLAPSPFNRTWMKPDAHISLNWRSSHD